MKLDIQEITAAWIDSYFATDEQKIIANKRNNICQSCPSLKFKLKKIKPITIQTCSECGCPISKKIFSNKINACPLGKWNKVDSEHKDFFENKKSKSKLL